MRNEGVTGSVHKAVLVQEVLSNLNVSANKNYIDGTVGGGGHAEAILKATGPKGMLLGLDADPQALVRASERLQKFGNRVILKNKNYKQINNIINDLPNSFSISGVLLDLGLSSDQLDLVGRGFSFADTGLLDMRFNPNEGKSAQDILKQSSESELAKIFREYGEIKQWKRLAKKFSSLQKHYRNRDVTVPEVVEVITGIVPRGKSRINPATKVFQALRIAVNQELDNVEVFLHNSLECLPSGCRIVIISFHSLEDRIVKHFFQTYSKPYYGPKESPLAVEERPARLKIITKKVVKASPEEIKTNPRSRSALLRVAEII